MINSENDPIFVDSVLKVTANENIDLTKELAAENNTNKTIEELLENSDAETKE
jgi:hypothetical protein